MAHESTTVPVVSDDRDQARRRLLRHPPANLRTVDGRTFELIDGAERVDRATEERFTREARQRWEDERERRLRERQADRERLTLGGRLDRALALIELGRSVRARRIAAQRVTSEDGPGGAEPAAAEGPEIDWPVERIRLHVEEIERALDGELGLLERDPLGDRVGRPDTVEAARLSSTEHRDAMLFEGFQGVDSQLVADEAPYLAGSARIVEQARLDEATRRGLRVRARDGVVLGEREVPLAERIERGTVRRVRIT